MIWMLLVLLYGVLKGVREVIKKKSLEKNTVMEVLFLYTFIGFLMVAPDYKNAMGMKPTWYFFVALKSFIIFLAWIFSFKAIKKMPISLYGVLDLSRVLFATLLGTIVLGEVLSGFQVTGLIFVSLGLLMLKYKPHIYWKNLIEKRNIKVDVEGTHEMQSALNFHKFGKTDDLQEASRIDLEAKNSEVSKVATIPIEPIQTKIIIYAFASCFLNAISGLMDKILMRDMNSSQLQFWYMLFLVTMYGIYLVVTKTKIRWKSLFQNYWIWILSFLFIVADRALFIANGMEGSRVTIMTLIKQSGCLVTILAGKFIYHEKDIRYKFLCALVIVVGIIIAVL